MRPGKRASLRCRWSLRPRRRREELAGELFLVTYRDMVGILVHGNNHFIVSGPLPEEAQAVALARHFSVVQIGAPIPAACGAWQIRAKEFRENLQWAVIVPGDRNASPGVVALLEELSARGIAIHKCSSGCW
jgi:hypothetical protein